MNFQHVTVAQFVVGTDDASCPTVDAPNEPCLQIGVNAPRQGFRVKTGRNNQRIGQHLTVTVHPVRFVLNRINNDVLELVEENLVQEPSNAGSTGALESLLHVRQSLGLRVVQFSGFVDVKG